jgi:two-component system sensor histidine kinase TctE
VVSALNGLLARVDQMLSAQQRFIADAAHQLRTPIAGLKTQAEMALRTRDPEALRGSLDNIVAATARMGSLVARMLALARAEPDAREAVMRQPMDLEQLARTLTTDAIPRALEAGIDLGFASPEHPIPMEGDPILLRELIGNLLDNALRYCPPGSEVTVEVSMGGDTATISVTDDGPGVPPEEHERVFERFHRLADSTIPGSGHGLAIVREVAGAHGGQAFLTSGPDGRGTRVVVTLPRASAQDSRH